MKLYKIGLLFLALVLGVSSCKKEYLDRKPTGQAAMDDVFNTISGARAAVNGIHRMMYEYGGDQHYEFGQPSINMMFDLMGEDFIPSRSGHFNASYNYNAARAPTATGTYAFRFYYRMVNNANIIIQNIDDVPAEQTEKDNVKAQALFYRAYAYYNLANMFSFTYALIDPANTLCVPLYTEPTQVGNPRATVAAVYTQITKDIDDAITLFDGSDVARGDKSQIDGSVARGLGARVALVMQDWTKAATLANEARQDYTYMTGTQLLAGFNDINSSEWIWGSAINTEQATSYASFISFMDRDAQGYAYVHGFMRIQNALLNDNIASTDVRKMQFTTREQATQPDYPYTQYEQRKFKVRVLGTWLADYPLMRAAEMALIEAEALAQQNNLSGAQTVLEEFVHTRNPEFTADVSSSEALIQQIWLQRRIELWGEGFRYIDLKRQCARFGGRQLSEGLLRSGNLNAQLAGGVLALQIGDTRWLFRFPSDEILRNESKIEQNP